MIARDLQPKTDVKGGGGVRGESKKGGTGTTGSRGSHQSISRSPWFVFTMNQATW